jgi:hypothetical protein
LVPAVQQKGKTIAKTILAMVFLIAYCSCRGLAPAGAWNKKTGKHNA